MLVHAYLAWASTSVLPIDYSTTCMTLIETYAMPLFSSSSSSNPYRPLPLTPLSGSTPRSRTPSPIPIPHPKKHNLITRKRLVIFLITSIASLSILVLILHVAGTTGDFSETLDGVLPSSEQSKNRLKLDAPGNGYLSLPPSISSAFALDLTTSISPSSLTTQDEDPFSSHNSLSYQAHNTLTLLTLSSCLALGKCGPNQTKVALLAAHWFDEAVVRGWRGGEGVWAISVYKNLRALGYTTLFSNSFEEALAQYRLFPSLVKVIIRNTPSTCHLSPTCVKSPSNPTGIPAWKIFDFEFFPSLHGTHYGASKLGGKWILSAEVDPRVGGEVGEEVFQYIGYSIEDDCNQALSSSTESKTNGTTPQTQTKKLSTRPRQAWILMKQLEYLYDHRFAWNTSYFSLAAGVLSSSLSSSSLSSSSSLTNDESNNADPNTNNNTFTFLGAWQNDPYYLGWDPATQGSFTDIADPLHGVVNLLSSISDSSAHAHENPDAQKTKLSPAEFMSRVMESRVMVGVGNPFTSPSPWAGLCLGVPFLNPIITWKHDDPWNKSFWDTQHPSLNRYGPPYVYHVHARNFTAFVQAIQEASTTEIPSFVPEHMTHTLIQRRLTVLMETDWRAKAEVLLRERMKEIEEGKEDIYIFEL